jgi:manganese transport protein
MTLDGLDSKEDSLSKEESVVIWHNESSLSGKVNYHLSNSEEINMSKSSLFNFLIKCWPKLNNGAELNSSSAYASVPVASLDSPWYKQLFSYTGLGLLISVGYIDPGNYSTDIAGGSTFGYTLMSIIFISNIFAILLQYLSLKVGVARDQDLAQSIRAVYHPYLTRTLWIIMEFAIAATDLAEVIGSAVALNLLFGIPILWGCIITGLDVLLLLMLQQNQFKKLEILVSLIVMLTFSCFLYQIIVSNADWAAIGSSLLLNPSIFQNSAEFFIAIGILGATGKLHCTAQIIIF